MSTSAPWPAPGPGPVAWFAQAPGIAASREPRQPWDLLLVCLAVYILTAIGRLHQLFDVLNPLRLTLIATGGATLAYATSGGSVRRFAPILRLRTTRFLLALTVWMALSIVGALWPGGAFHLFTDEFLKMVLIYLVIVGAVRGFRDVERLAFTYLVSVAVYSAVVLARFNVGGDRWRLAGLYYYDANEFGTLAVMCLPLAVYFLVRPGPLWRRLVSAGALVALLVGFIWTGSRGGFLALLGVGAFLLLRYTAIRARWRILITSVLALLFAATASDKYWESMRTMLQPKDDYNLTDDAGRVQVWKRGLGYMMQHPVFGVGAGNFPTAEGTLSPLAANADVGRPVKWSVAHNSFLQIGAELGLPGLIFFLGMLVSAFGALRAVQRTSAVGVPRGRSPPARALAQALAAALVGYIVGGFFLALAYHELLYTLIALCVALQKVATDLRVRPASIIGPRGHVLR
ncbi:MAG TPA: O-antigen ligase family protein [Gemmatimonadales bacterium]|nr:O-antigen ligase family protein [Gemmatimonadales bacterium]